MKKNLQICVFNLLMFSFQLIREMQIDRIGPWIPIFMLGKLKLKPKHWTQTIPNFKVQ